ncbi:virulence promoting factor [uncultured Cedecea sp.]|nr:virulence promoting factor [uncultured Cedecea sp.]
MKNKPKVQSDCQIFLLPDDLNNGLLFQYHPAIVVNCIVYSKQREVRHG